MDLTERFGFVLSAVEREWLRQLAAADDRSEASTLRLMIRRAARDRGFNPARGDRRLVAGRPHETTRQLQEAGQ